MTAIEGPTKRNINICNCLENEKLLYIKDINAIKCQTGTKLDSERHRKRRILLIFNVVIFFLKKKSLRGKLWKHN